MTSITRRSRTASNTPETDPPARFRDLVAAEWIKLRSLRSTYWILGLGVLVVIGINVQATIARYRLLHSWSATDKATYNWMNDALGQAPYLLLMIGAGSLGALSMAGEYATGMISTTFAAVPARRSVVTAKVTVVSATMLVLSTVVATASVGLAQAILSGRGAGFDVGDPGVPTAIVASAIVVPVCALIGLALGVVIRHTAAAIVGVFVLLIILPQLTSGTTYSWVVDINNAMPWPAWMALRNTPIRGDMPVELFPWPVAGSWLVLLVWPVASVVVALIVAHRRDV